jgi:hypothetical protein
MCQEEVMSVLHKDPAYNRVRAVLPGELGPPHRGIMVPIRGNLASKKPITPDTPLSKTRSRRFAPPRVDNRNELGFDMRQCKEEVPLQLLKADRNIQAFYGYNKEIKKFCINYEGCDEYEWLERSELHGVNSKWIELCKKQGHPEPLTDSNGNTCFMALAGDDSRDLRCLLTAFSAACPALTTHLGMMDPVPLNRLKKLCRDDTWPIQICSTVLNPQSVQAGDYIISTSRAHCEFRHFDETTPLTGVHMAVRIVQRLKAKSAANTAKNRRKRDAKRRKIALE